MKYIRMCIHVYIYIYIYICTAVTWDDINMPCHAKTYII